MDTPASIIGAYEVLTRATRQLHALPGSRMLAYFKDIRVPRSSSSHRRRPARDDSYVLYKELLAMNGVDGLVCVVGHGFCFDCDGIATNAGQFAAILLEPHPLVPDGMLSAYATRELMDVEGRSILLEYDSRGAISIGTAHEWYEPCSRLLHQPLKDRAVLLEGGLVRYAASTVGIITGDLLDLIAARRA